MASTENSIADDCTVARSNSARNGPVVEKGDSTGALDGVSVQNLDPETAQQAGLFGQCRKALW